MLVKFYAVHCKIVNCCCVMSVCCFNSTVNIASCLLGSAQTNMASVKAKLLQSVALFFFSLFLWLFHWLIYSMVASEAVMEP